MKSIFATIIASFIWFFSLAHSQPPAALKKARHVLYINFEGVTLTHGAWNPMANTATLPSHFSGSEKAVFPFYSPPCKVDADCRVGKCDYPMPEKKAYKYNPLNEADFKRCSMRDTYHEKMIHYYVQKGLQDFDVDVVLEQPAEGDFTMAIVAYNSTIGMQNPGSGGLNCSGNPDPQIVLIADSAFGYSTKYLASVILHEYGHTLGLGHNTLEAKTPDPMGARDDSDPKFLNKCTPHDFDAQECIAYATQICPKGKQNTYKTLLRTLRPRVGKLIPKKPVEAVDFILTKYQGNPQGERSHAVCENSHLIGITWYQGAIIDRIRGICTKSQETSDVGAESGNGPHSFVCPGAGNKISSISVWSFGEYGAIDGLRVKCALGQTGGPIQGAGGRGKLGQPALACPAGSEIIGLSGTKKAWLDALALICSKK